MVVSIQSSTPTAMSGITTPKPKASGKLFAIQRLAILESRFVTFMNRSLIYLRFVGAYPLKHKSGWTRICPYLLAYNIALNVVFVPATAYVAFSWDQPLINSTIRCMNMVIFVISLILFSFRLIKGFRHMGNIFQMIESVEKRLSSLGTYFSYGFPPIIYTFLTMLLLIGSMTIKGFQKGFQSYFKDFISYYMQLIHTLNLFGFATLLNAVEVQLTNATEYLLWIMNNPSQRKRKVEVSENLVEVHEDLCSISSEISSFYSLQMLFTVTAGFISFVANAYFCVNGRDSLATMAQFLFEALIGLLHGFLVCSSSVKVSKKAKEFNTLLYQLMIDDKTNEISENKKLRLHISMKREVAFSACGFFNLDFTLVHSMVAAATTYLVILIQFGQPGDAPPSPAPTNMTVLVSTTVLSKDLTTPS